MNTRVPKANACQGLGEAKHDLDWHVRFGSKADIGAPRINVRFTPESGHRNRHAGSNSGSFATLAAIRRASSFVSSLAADLRAAPSRRDLALQEPVEDRRIDWLSRQRRAMGELERRRCDRGHTLLDLD